MPWFDVSAASRMLPHQCHHLARQLRAASGSSNRWLSRQKRDVFVKQRAQQGFRSRAAFKLTEIALQNKPPLFHSNATVVEFGASPGSWTQAASRYCKFVIAVDLQPMTTVDLSNVHFIHGDARDPLVHVQIERAMRNHAVDGKADLVLSDMAPAASGMASLDHIRQMSLCESAYESALQWLKPAVGVLLMKCTRGGEEVAFRQSILQSGTFSSCKFIKPAASRQDSREMYLLCQGFRGSSIEKDIDSSIA